MLDCLVGNRGRGCSGEYKCSVACLTCYSFAGLCGCSSVQSGEVVEAEIPKTLELRLVVVQRCPLACSDMG